jgi:hypothetical protein
MKFEELVADAQRGSPASRDWMLAAAVLALSTQVGFAGHNLDGILAILQETGRSMGQEALSLESPALPGHTPVLRVQRAG